MGRGYFKTTRFPSEKKGTRTTKSMTDFSDFIEDMGLVDLALMGGTKHEKEE